MSESHADEWVQRYLAGEVEPDEVERACALDPALEGRLRALDGLGQALDACAAEERATLAEAEGVECPEWEERLVRTLDRPRRRSLRLLAAPLIVVAAAVLLLMFIPPSGAPPDPSLSGHDLQLHPPGRTGTAWGPFRFEVRGERAALPPLKIQVFSGDLPLGEPLIVSPVLDGTSWSPPTEETRAWGEVITWQVISENVGNPPTVHGTWPE